RLFDFSFVWTTAMLFLMLMDPFGNLPVFMSTLKHVRQERLTWVIFRELCFALVAMVLSLVAGQAFFGLLHIEAGTLAIAGGIILFLTGIKMVFSSLAEDAPVQQGEPFIVPLAIPLICGPGLIAILSTLRGSVPQATLPNCLLALAVAWVIQTAIMLCGRALSRVLGKRGLNALESLMGLLLTSLAVGMVLQGINQTYHLG
ncbi:MAG: MarC family protein, partial [Candidatus Spyradenecus sp.]